MSIKEYIDSGILEQYVMGMASKREQEEVEMMAAANPDIRREINAISDVLEKYAQAHAIKPSRLIKPMLMATIDYTERIKKGEPVSFPPTLNENSTVEDYAGWLNRPDLNSPGTDADDIFAKIIGYAPGIVTAIVWIKNDTPWEIHDKEYESFLIVEGTCDIIVGNKTIHLVPGDYFSIPFNEYHRIKTASSIACKAILQRVAA